MIHHGYQVETPEIARRELAGTMVERVAMPLSTLPHTTVGQLAHVPGADASGVYIELIIQSSLCHEMPHDAVCCWRAADITQAYKENLLHSLH
jgi:hypothetical protein